MIGFEFKMICIESQMIGIDYSDGTEFKIINIEFKIGIESKLIGI